MSKKIVFIVDQKGSVKVEAVNFEGEACTEATKKFTDILGVKTEETLKPEFYQEDEQVEKEGY